MYGTGGAGVGTGLAVTGLNSGSHVLAAIGMIFAGMSMFMFFRKSSPVKP